jgi:HlyD family secretion protein
MKRAPRIIIAAVALSSIAALLVYRNGAASDHGQQIFASGTIEATEAELGFQVSGRLERIGVREGDNVAAGADLASLERFELLAQRGEAVAQVAAAKATLQELIAGPRQEEIARARAAVRVATERRDAAQRDVERLRPLTVNSLISKQAFDYKESDLAVAEGEMARAIEEHRLLATGTRPERIAGQRALLAQATAALERIDARLAQTTMHAPFAGVVTARHREPGEALPAGAAVLTLRNIEDRWVRIYVPGDEVGKLAIGQPASIAADGFAAQRFTGKVIYIASVAEFTPRNVQTTKDRVRLVYEVRIRITGDENMDLKPGLPADVTLATNAMPAALGNALPPAKPTAAASPAGR